MNEFTAQYISALRLKSEPLPGSYLCDLPVVQHLAKMEELPFSSPVTFLVGENGTGKSTLLEAIAAAFGFNPEGGTKNFNFSTKDTHSELYELITLSKGIRPKDGFFLRAETMYNLATDIDRIGAEQSYGGVSLHEQSHGESFLAVAMNRFSGNGLYILDEPEAALSPMRIMSLMAIIDELVKKNSQFIISTHSPILMAFPGATIYELSNGGIEQVSYTQTDHYNFTRRFLENPERYLSYLLGS